MRTRLSCWPARLRARTPRPTPTPTPTRAHGACLGEVLVRGWLPVLRDVQLVDGVGSADMWMMRVHQAIVGWDLHDLDGTDADRDGWVAGPDCDNGDATRHSRRLDAGVTARGTGREDDGDGDEDGDRDGDHGAPPG
jgi:hypothetical protein